MVDATGSASARSRSRTHRRRLAAIGGLVTAIVAGYAAITVLHADAADQALLSQGKPVTASSREKKDAFAPELAVDGDTGTRWSSAFADPQWLQVDLGATATLSKVSIDWEAAYANSFTISASADGTTFTTLTPVTVGKAGEQSLDLHGSGRYVRLTSTARATPYGVSLFEFQVFGSFGADVPASPASPSASATPAPATPNRPAAPVSAGGDLGSNVIVFDPSMSSAAIQSKADAVFKQQESNQFGTQRYVLAFSPGTYNDLNIQVGFYTSVIGLGQNPDDVRINGDLTVDAGWFQGNATQNFWRSAENLSLYPVSGADRWAVAQAAPLRRMDVHGDLMLAPDGFGWASGGYLADSRVSGKEQPISQQQWFTRDSQIGSNSNGVWNMTFSGVQGAPAQSFPQSAYTVVPKSPVIREKPYLYRSGADYAVFVPSLQHNASGVSWAGGSTPGESIPLSRFFVAQPGDSAATINAALAQGLNLMFTPGIYHVDQTIAVTRADTVVLGLGYATLIPDNGVTPMRVGDVDGVKVAGLLFDAGTTNSANLLVIGSDGASADHAADPITVQDVFFRIGGAGPGKATNSLLVNSDDTIIDHIWAWRADHGAGAGWTENPADTGLTVNGDDVTAYGLFVEHYQKYEVMWNGENGRTIFLQNEMPYDPPSQAAWRSGADGYAAYKVADDVKNHEAWGLGSYCNFTADSSIHADRAFEVPVTANVKLHDLLTVSLGGKGTIDHVINSTGAAAQGTATVPVNVVDFP